MKLNLGCGQDIRTGYINIDIKPPGGMSPELYRQGDIRTLDWLTEDGAVEEIVALDCLEYLPINAVKPALINWAQKLFTGGVLKILIPDCYAVAKAFAQGQFDLQEYSKITLGTQEETDNRLSMIDANTLLDILQEVGLTIGLKRYEGVALYVEMTK